MFICPNCTESFTSKRGLKMHINRCSQKNPKATSLIPTQSWNSFLIGIFVILLLTNLGVMGFFTITVNNKLNEAIEIAKPQKGTLTLITPEDCPQCRNLEALKSKISAQNVELTAEQTFSEKSVEGKNLIGKFEIQKLPALVFEAEGGIKVPFKKAFEKESRAIGETTLVWEQNQPPYFDLKTNTTAGLVKITFLTDKSCEECYDVVAVQKPILGRFGVVLSEEKIVDVSGKEGKDLLEKYNINNVPTIILSPEAKAYGNSLVKIWSQVGTIAEDGSFIFQKMGVIQANYRDLKTGKIIKQQIK